MLGDERKVGGQRTQLFHCVPEGRRDHVSDCGKHKKPGEVCVLNVRWEEGLREWGKGRKREGDVGVPTSTLPTGSAEC